MMNPWLVVELVILIVVLGIVVGAVSENFTDNLYKRRNELAKASDERQGRTVFKGTSNS